MNKKIFTYFVIFSFLFTGITFVSADEEDTVAETPSATPSLYSNTTARPTPTVDVEQKPITDEIQRKNNLQKQYKQKLEELQNKNKEQKIQIQTAQKGTASSTQNRIQSTKESIEQKKEVIKEKIQKQRALIKEKLEGQRKERVKNQINQTGENFEKAIEKIQELEKKVHERIKEMTVKGFDMSKPEEITENTHIKIAEAQKKIQEMKTALGEITESEDPSEAFIKARELTTPAKEAIREAHQSLVEVIKAIKASIKIKTPETSAPDSENTENTTENNTTN